MRPFHERLPDDLDVTHQLGLHLYRSGEQQLAVPLLESASADPRRFDASWLLLQHYYRQANWKAGLVHAERYLEARPDDTEALALIGTYFLKAEQFDRAIATLDRYLEREPKNVSARINRANALFRSGDVERAGKEYEKLLAEEPDKSRFLYNLASVRIRQDRCDEALALLDRFLAKEPKNGPALYFRADCMLKLGRYDEAQRAFEQAGVDGQSKNPWVWYGLSRVALRQGQVDKATDHAVQATQLGPQEAELASWLGTVHRKAQRYVDALRWHDKALTLGEAASYHAERGYDLWALVRHAESLAAFERAAALDPTLGGVGEGIAANRAALGLAAWKGGDAVLATSLLERAVEAAPAGTKVAGTARANLAVVQVATGKLDAAEKTLAGGAGPDVLTASALLALSRDKTEDATRLAGLARAEGTGLTTVLALVEAQLAAKRGDWDEAVKGFDAVLAGGSSGTGAVGGGDKLELARAISQLELGLERLGRGDAGGARDMLTRAQRFAAKLDPEDRLTIEFALTALAVLGAENAEAAAKNLAGQLAGPRFAGAQWARVRDIGHGYVAYGWLRANNPIEARKALERVRDRAALGAAFDSLMNTADDVEARRAFAANDHAKAERLWAALAQRMPAEAAYSHNLAAARFMAGRSQEAEAAWRTLVDGGAPPAPIEAIYNLANALARRGEHRQAFELFERYGKTGGPQADRARERAQTRARLFGYGGAP
jgi:tetratricopeptide (TPR) repeat protein